MVARMVELSNDLLQQIEELARQTGRPEEDLLAEAVASYVQTRRVPRPKSDGTIEDPDIAARDIDDWLTANWRPE